MEDLLERNSCQTLQNLYTSLKDDRSTVGKRFKALGSFPEPKQRKLGPILSQVAKPVKTLKWKVFTNPPCSPFVVPSNYHRFRSMAHGLSDVKLTS